MTYAPADLLAVRSDLMSRLNLAPAAVGIVGDPAHAAGGGYHEGNNDLQRVGRLSSDYSKRESPRDRPGGDAASALDIGEFDVTRPTGRRVTLRSLSAGLVDACRRGDPRTRDIREVIYSPDGVGVTRWDRLGIRSGGDTSHRVHTHTSFFRDSEGRRHLQDNVLGLLVELIEGSDMGGEFADAALHQLDGGNALGEVYLRLMKGAGANGQPPTDGVADFNLRAAVLIGREARAAAWEARDAAREAAASAKAAYDAYRMPAPLDVDRLAKALEAAAEAAVRRVLGTLDGSTPPAQQ